MHFCPSNLALEVVWRLRDDLELCPELRELEVTVTGRICKTVAEIAVEMVKARASGGDGKVMMVGYLLPKGSRRREVMLAMVVVWHSDIDVPFLMYKSSF